jgi:cytochrome c oxidase subunit 4
MRSEPITGEVLSRKTYATVFIVLLCFTAITALVSFVDLGRFNTFVALAIAGIKATLVAMFFMGVIHSPRLTRVIVAASLLWLAIMLMLTLGDYLTRGWLPYPGK